MHMRLPIVAVVTSAFVRAGNVFLEAHAVTLLALGLLALAEGVANFLLQHLLLLLKVRVAREVFTVSALTSV
jgi:hypothetical protein